MSNEKSSPPQGYGHDAKGAAGVCTLAVQAIKRVGDAVHELGRRDVGQRNSFITGQ